MLKCCLVVPRGWALIRQLSHTHGFRRLSAGDGKLSLRWQNTAFFLAHLGRVTVDEAMDGVLAAPPECGLERLAVRLR